MVESEVKSGQEQRPSSLSSVQFLGCHKVLQIFVVCPYLEGVLSPFQIMSPLFQCSDNGEHFLIMDFIVPLYFIQAFGQKGYRMHLPIFPFLRQHSTSCKVRTVCL